MPRRGIEKEQLVKNVLDCCIQRKIQSITKTKLSACKAKELFVAWEAFRNGSFPKLINRLLQQKQKKQLSTH